MWVIGDKEARKQNGDPDWDTKPFPDELSIKIDADGKRINERKKRKKPEAGKAVSTIDKVVVIEDSHPAETKKKEMSEESSSSDDDESAVIGVAGKYWKKNSQTKSSPPKQVVEVTASKSFDSHQSSVQVSETDKKQLGNLELLADVAHQPQKQNIILFNDDQKEKSIVVNIQINPTLLARVLLRSATAAALPGSRELSGRHPTGGAHGR